MREKAPFTTKLESRLPGAGSTRDYEGFVLRKVEAARRDVCAGRGRSNVDVEADFAAHREELLRKPNEEQ